MPESSAVDVKAFIFWLMENRRRWTRNSQVGLRCFDVSVRGVAVLTEVDVLASAVSLVKAEIGEKALEVRDQDVWTAIQNLRMLQVENVPASLLVPAGAQPWRTLQQVRATLGR